MNYYNLIDVLLLIMEEHLMLGVHTKNASYVVDPASIILFEDRMLCEQVYAGGSLLLIKYDDIEELSSVNFDIDVDEYCGVHASPYDVTIYKVVNKKPLKFRRR